MERVVAFAREHESCVVHDFAYADLAFDGYEPPSILQVPGADDVAVELYTLTKSFSMAGWRSVPRGNARSSPRSPAQAWLDYGTFQPIQIAAITAMNEAPETPREVRRSTVATRHALRRPRARGWTSRAEGRRCSPGRRAGAYAELGSLAFAELLAREASVAVSPGVGSARAARGSCASRSSRTSTASAGRARHRHVLAGAGRGAGLTYAHH